MSAATRSAAPRPLRARFSTPGRIAAAVVLLWLLVALLGPWITPHDPGEISEAGVFAQASARHWMGTDYLGRDMASRVIQGARYTVGVALLATLLASGGGILLALFSATAGRWIDATIARAIDMLVSIPNKMLALLLVAAFGSSIPLLIVTAAIVYLPGAYRIARSLAVNVGAMDYVTIARVRGESTFYIMRREILPNIAGPMLADLGLRFVYVVLLMAGLSFLGLGVQPPNADWGSLVRENLGGLGEAAAAVIAPSIAIATLTIAVNVVIDHLPGRGGSGPEG